ncbi:MAG: hypothetical protein ABFS86_05895 [Planctomycetota bacterium]
MSRWPILFLLAAVAGLGFLLVPGPRSAKGPLPLPPTAPAQDQPSLEMPQPVARTGPDPAPPAVAVAIQDPASSVADLREELTCLLKALRSKGAAGHSLEDTLDEIGALLRKSPGLIRILVALVPESDRNFRSLLLHAVRRSGNRRLRATLSAAIAEAADPGQKRVRELLASSPDRIAAAIQDLSSARDRKDLVQGLSRSQVAAPSVLTALALAADGDPDAEVRRASLYRLGKSGDPRGREKVLEVLGNTSLSSRDRATAALALGGRTTKEDWTVFVEILRRADESIAVLKLAANGLSQAVGQPDADDALFQCIECRNHDPEVRKSAVVALALGGQRLKGTARSEFETRAYGVLVSLEKQRDSEQIYAWSRSHFADSFSAGFRSLLRPEAASQSTLSDPGEQGGSGE